MLSLLQTKIAYAATANTFIGNLRSQIIQPIIILFYFVATVIFIWGIIEMIMNADNEEARSKGKQHMIWGIIGLAIMVAAGGLVGMLCSFVGLSSSCN